MSAKDTVQYLIRSPLRLWPCLRYLACIVKVTVAVKCSIISLDILNLNRCTYSEAESALVRPCKRSVMSFRHQTPLRLLHCIRTMPHHGLAMAIWDQRIWRKDNPVVAERGIIPSTLSGSYISTFATAGNRSAVLKYTHSVNQPSSSCLSAVWQST